LLTGTVSAQPYSYSFNAKQGLKSNGTGNGSMTLDSNANLDLTAFGRNSRLEFVTNAQVVPDDASNPLAGGTLDWQDAITLKQGTATLILIERGEGLHLGTCGQYDAGRIVIVDASPSSTVLEFGPACGEVQFLRDGTSFMPTLGGINLEPSTKMSLGAKTVLPVSIMDLAGRNLQVQANWTSSNTAIVGVDQGNLNAVATGLATISASYGGKSASSNVTVNVPQLLSITITPATAAIKYGQTQQFTATATTTTGESFTLQAGNVTWASSVPAVAIIGANGLAMAQAITGNTNITVTAFGKTSSASVLSVSAPAVATITVAPVTASIPVGGTQAFTANAFDAGGILVPGVVFTWASSAPTVASISVGGLASASTTVPGTTNITASAGGKTSLPAVLTVTDFTLTSLPAPLTFSVIRVLPATTTALPLTGIVTTIAGLTGTVTYSLDPLTVPVGVTLTPPLITPVPLSPTAASSPMTLNIATTVVSSVVPYVFNLVATSNTVPTIKHTLPITLTITGP
jgi:hypothetical protein